MRRRRLIALGGAATALAAAAGGTAVHVSGRSAWKAAQAALRRPPDTALAGMAARHELVRLATLAANSHNTQPWRFVAEESRIAILPDLARRCPSVDPDDHHLFASLGAAAETIVQAAPAFGLAATPRFVAEGDGRIELHLARAPVTPAPLLGAILERQCTRAPYATRPVPPADLAALAEAASLDGVQAVLQTEPAALAAIGVMVVDGNAAQMRDPAFMAELVAWMRFSHGDAAAAGDGLFSASSGNPALPGWIARRLLPLVFTEAAETTKYRAQLAASAGVAVFAAPEDAPAGWVLAGRACQRFALRATTLGLRHAFINQPVEVPALRPRFAAAMGLAGRRPNLVVRFGYGDALPFSLRRPVAQVLADRPA